MIKIQRTFTILKPDSIQDSNIGSIIKLIEEAGFKILALKMIKITPYLAETFYEVHKDRPFYGELVEYMSSDRVVAMVLEKENAVVDYRKLVGATDPSEADSGTIRAQFARSKGQNAVHGSDSVENAKDEISFFFAGVEIFD